RRSHPPRTTDDARANPSTVGRTRRGCERREFSSPSAPPRRAPAAPGTRPSQPPPAHHGTHGALRLDLPDSFATPAGVRRLSLWTLSSGALLLVACDRSSPAAAEASPRETTAASSAAPASAPAPSSP